MKSHRRTAERLAARTARPLVAALRRRAEAEREHVIIIRRVDTEGNVLRERRVLVAGPVRSERVSFTLNLDRPQTPEEQ
jgi:hypothetical protein